MIPTYTRAFAMNTDTFCSLWSLGCTSSSDGRSSASRACIEIPNVPVDLGDWDGVLLLCILLWVAFSFILKHLRYWKKSRLGQRSILRRILKGADNPIF